TIASFSFMLGILMMGLLWEIQGKWLKRLISLGRQALDWVLI
ncbi:hypothetical protein A2U01_0078696, partial [Trifolium medium]|nr:hypothetical protein [Trifolium medium]